MGKIAAYIVIWALTFGAWLQHVVFCIQHEKWLFLVAGAICAPVGMIHGWGIWLGFWA